MSDKYDGLPFALTDTREKARDRKDARDAERENPAYLAWIRKQPCLIADKHKCHSRVQSHHEPPARKGEDWADTKTVPLCVLAHHDRHRLLRTRFELRYGIRFDREIERLKAQRKAEG